MILLINTTVGSKLVIANNIKDKGKSGESRRRKATGLKPIFNNEGY